MAVRIFSRGMIVGFSSGSSSLYKLGGLDLLEPPICSVEGL
jgi:hypothetical protein